MQPKLKSGHPVFGCFVHYPEPGFAQFLGYQTWDFFVFDVQRRTIKPGNGENRVCGAERNDVTALVQARVHLHMNSYETRFSQK